MRSIWGRVTPFTFALAVALGPFAPALAGAPALRAVLESRVARYVLEETMEGERGFEAGVGAPYESRSVDAPPQGLERASRRREFPTAREARLVRIEERFRFNRERPRLDSRPITRLTAADESLLGELATEELGIASGGYGSRARIRFSEPPADSSYLRTRATFEGPPMADAFPHDVW